MTHSLYPHEFNRLAAVLSAIQVMGTYGFYTLGFAGWADRISGDEEDGFPLTPGGNDGGGWIPAPANGCRVQALCPVGMTEGLKVKIYS